MSFTQNENIAQFSLFYFIIFPFVPNIIFTPDSSYLPLYCRALHFIHAQGRENPKLLNCDDEKLS